MKIDIENLKKKILYRSQYRGTREMDKLLGAFTRKYINQLSDNDLFKLEKLLNVDDSNLYNFLNGLETNTIIEENNVTDLFKNFNYIDE